MRERRGERGEHVKEEQLSQVCRRVSNPCITFLFWAGLRCPERSRGGPPPLCPTRGTVGGLSPCPLQLVNTCCAHCWLTGPQREHALYTAEASRKCANALEKEGGENSVEPLVFLPHFLRLSKGQLSWVVLPR